MRIAIRRRDLLATALLAPLAGRSARAQDKAPRDDTLMGLWRGELQGMPGNNRRTLRINGFRPDGSLAATWEGHAIEVSRRDGVIAFRTHVGNPTQLSPQPDGTLAGWLVAEGGRGQRYRLVMRRQ